MTFDTTWPLRILIYGAGDALDAYGSGALDQNISAQLSRLQKIITNQYIAGVAELSSSRSPSVRFVLDPSGRQPVQNIPGYDAGDPAQLVDFVRYAATVCPSRQTVIVLSGHGVAWQDSVARQALSMRGLSRPPVASQGMRHPLRLFGVGPVSSGDARAVLVDGTYRDFISNAQLGSLFGSIATTLASPIDVLVFDACLMSSWEICAEIRDSVRTVVASIDELSASGIDISPALGSLTNAGGGAPPETIAGLIATGFVPQASFDSCAAINLRSPAYASALADFKSFASSLLAWCVESPQNVAQATTALAISANSIVKYASGCLADVAAMWRAFQNIPGLPAPCLNSIQSAARNLAGSVIGKSAGSDYSSALGLSVFAPNSYETYSSNRNDYASLRFPSQTGWLAVLDRIFGGADRTIALPPPAPTGPATSSAISVAAGDSVFRIVLRGMPLDAATLVAMRQVLLRVLMQSLAQINCSDYTIRRVDGIGGPGTTIVLMAVGNHANGPAANSRPLTSVCSSEQDTEFIVCISGLNLAPDIVPGIEEKLRMEAMAQLATMDQQFGVQLPSDAAAGTRFIIGDFLGIAINVVSKALA